MLLDLVFDTNAGILERSWGCRRAGRSIEPKSEVGCVWLFLLLLCRGDLNGCFGLRSLQIGFTGWGRNFPSLLSEPAQISHVGM